MKTYLSIIAFTILLLGCKKNQVSSTFDENLKIKMSEKVDSTKMTLTLNCYTEKIFGCSNYSIKSSFSVTNDKITINFTELIIPNICLTSLGPASTIINIETLTNKIYELELNIGSTKISGQLDVATGSFKATLPVQSKVQFTNPNLKRIPQNTIYGTIHYHSSATSLIVQKFIDTLQILGAVPTTYTPGDYGNFQIEANGQIKQTQDLGYYFTRYYIFNYTNNSTQLKDLVKHFGVNYGSLLLVTLNTTKGETFYSWTP